MAYLPGDEPDRFAAARETAPIEDNPFFAVLEGLVARLGDRLDHPEIWPMLAEAARHADVAELRALIPALRPGQTAPVMKILDTVAALLDALSGDRAGGRARLAHLASLHMHCPQIAGALFFLDRTGEGRSADLSDRFCESPFVKFETLMDGSVAPCCSIWTQQRLGSLDGQTYDEIWNSAAAQDMRASILDGSYRHCNKQRCTLILEDALPKRNDVTDGALRRFIDEGLTHVEGAPRWLFLAHDVTCNLACPSCRDHIEAADERQEARFDRIEQQVFRPLLEADGEVLVSISGQGDPWSSPHYRSILRYLADHECGARVNLHTNALLMNPGRWEQYRGLERYRPIVDVSIDACSAWVYEVVRRPGNWSKLVPNLEFIAGHRAGGIFREFHLNATIQLDNFHEMPALIDFAERLGADSMRMYMIQNTGGHLKADYARKNVADPGHALHLAFLETLRDPRLGRPIAHLYDVATWRARALEAELPSDALGKDFTRAALLAAIDAATGNLPRIAALLAAGRARFAGDHGLLALEAATLHAMGHGQAAEYRLHEREAAGGDAIRLG